MTQDEIDCLQDHMRSVIGAAEIIRKSINQSVTVLVNYITDFPEGIKDQYVVMGLSLVGMDLDTTVRIADYRVPPVYNLYLTVTPSGVVGVIRKIMNWIKSFRGTQQETYH